MLRYAITTTLLLITLLCASCGTCDFVSGVRIESGSGQYTALTESSNCGPLLSEFDTFVTIERRYYIGRHLVWTSTKTVARGKLDLDKVTVRWGENDHLLVGCRCQKDDFDFMIRQWRGITVVYNFVPQK